MNAKTIASTLFVSAVLLAMGGCRKEFYQKPSSISTVTNEQAVQKFLMVPAGASPIVEKVINNIAKRENELHFLANFIHVHGMPVWDQVVEHATSDNVRHNTGVTTYSSGIKSLSGNASGWDFVFVPLINSISREVKTILQVYVKNDTGFRYVISSKIVTLAARKIALQSIINTRITIALFAAFEKKVNPSRTIIFPSPYHLNTRSPFFGHGIPLTESMSKEAIKAMSGPQNGDVYYVICGNWKIYYIYHSSTASWNVLHIAEVEEMQGDEGGGDYDPIANYYPVFYPDPLPGYDPGQYSPDPANWGSSGAVYPPDWVGQSPDNPPFTPPGPGENQELPQESGYVPSSLNADAALQYILLGLKNNPLALLDLTAVSSDVKQEWIDLASFTVSQNLKNRLSNIKDTIITAGGFLGIPLTEVDIARVQTLESANSSFVNMDYFPVNITVLPTINQQQVTAAQLLTYFRLTLNYQLDSAITSFKPFNYKGINDSALWNSANPNSALVDLNIPADAGTVITSFDPSTPSRWIFTTVHDPKNGNHPVSGNREFGYKMNTDGSYTFYTKGVDRLTELKGSLLQSITGIPFNTANDLWSSFQTKFTQFINTHSGAAWAPTPTIIIPNWDKVRDVMNGIVPLSDLIP